MRVARLQQRVRSIILDSLHYTGLEFLRVGCTQEQCFLLRDTGMHSAYLLRRRGWLAGWVSVTRRYCIKMAKPILKLLRPSGSPIILVSSDPERRYPIPRGTPSAGALNTRGRKNWRFSCNFRRQSPFISETVRDRPMVTMER